MTSSNRGLKVVRYQQPPNHNLNYQGVHAMTGSNVTTTPAKPAALDQLEKLTRQAAYLARLICDDYRDSGPRDKYDRDTDGFNNFELAVDIMSSAYAAATGDAAADTQKDLSALEDIQLSILYAREYFRLLFGKVGLNDFDRCATTTIAVNMAEELHEKIINLSGA